MRKKVVSVLLTAAMTATMLAGCGNKQTADSQLGESYEETMAAVQSEEAATRDGNHSRSQGTGLFRTG